MDDMNELILGNFRSYEFSRFPLIYSLLLSAMFIPFLYKVILFLIC